MEKPQTDIIVKTKTYSSTLAASLMVSISSVAFFLTWGMLAVTALDTQWEKFKIAANENCECTDGVDNDGDGLADADDPSCSFDRLKCNEKNIRFACDDGFDNSGDNLIDLNDPRCRDVGDSDEDIKWSFDTFGSEANPFFNVPALGNFDNNPELELFALKNKIGVSPEAYIFNNDGEILNHLGQDISSMDETYLSPPVVYDRDNDGLDEIFFEAYDFGNNSSRIFQARVEFSDSTPILNFFSVQVLSCDDELHRYVKGFSRPPAVGDLDNDGIAEVVVGTCDKLYVFQDIESQQIRWEKFISTNPVNENSDISTPILVDFDHDDNLDVVVAQIQDKGINENNPNLQSLWILVAYDSSGKKIAEYPIQRVGYENPWKHPQLAAGDVDANGTQDVVVGYNDRILALTLDGNTGQIMRLWENTWLHADIEKRVTGLALGDLTGDGKLDVIANYARFFYDIGGIVTVKNSGEFYWDYPVTNAVISPASLADVDNDNKLEVLTGSVLIRDFATPDPLLLQVIDDNGMPSLPHSFSDRKFQFTDYDPWNEEVVFYHPVIGDMGDPQRPSLIATGKLEHKARWGCAHCAGILYSLDNIVKINPAIDTFWLMYQHDAQHTSRANACTKDAECTAKGSDQICFKYSCNQRQEITFRRGDADANGKLDISDPIFTLLYLFRGGTEPSCLDAADSDDSGKIDMTDAVSLLFYQFRGEDDKVPPAPGPIDKGPDPTPDSLDCIQYP